MLVNEQCERAAEGGAPTTTNCTRDMHSGSPDLRPQDPEQRKPLRVDRGHACGVRHVRDTSAVDRRLARAVQPSRRELGHAQAADHDDAVHLTPHTHAVGRCKRQRRQPRQSQRPLNTRSDRLSVLLAHLLSSTSPHDDSFPFYVCLDARVSGPQPPTEIEEIDHGGVMHGANHRATTSNSPHYRPRIR